MNSDAFLRIHRHHPMPASLSELCPRSHGPYEPSPKDLGIGGAPGFQETNAHKEPRIHSVVSYPISKPALAMLIIYN